MAGPRLAWKGPARDAMDGGCWDGAEACVGVGDKGLPEGASDLRAREGSLRTGRGGPSGHKGEPEASCLGFYLEWFGVKEGKGHLGLRHIPLAVSKLEEGRAEAGRPGRRPDQGREQGRTWWERGLRSLVSLGLGDLLPGERVQQDPAGQAWVAGGC